MKTILTLKTSSMFFVGSVNLYKGIPTNVEVENLSPSTLRIVNQAIKSGRVESSTGLLEEVQDRGETTTTLQVDESPVIEIKEEIKEDVIDKEIEDVNESLEFVEEKPEVKEAVKVKPAPKKKTTPAKKTAE